MDIKDFSVLIGLSEQAAQICQDFCISQTELKKLYAQLQMDTEKFLQSENARQNPQQRLLALYVNFALLAKKQYEKRKIRMEIFYDTLADIALWEKEYFNENGSHGIAEAKWLAHHVTLKLFRLGALQFEPAQKLPLNLPESAKKLTAFYVHIPKGADISQKSVRQSLKMAFNFFKTDTALFLCHSWLLSPVLKQLLPQSSRILQFAANFNILSLDCESRQAEERIFGKVCDSPAKYTAKTSLQQAAKKYLLSGKDIPSAEGYFITQL